MTSTSSNYLEDTFGHSRLMWTFNALTDELNIYTPGGVLLTVCLVHPTEVAKITSIKGATQTLRVTLDLEGQPTAVLLVGKKSSSNLTKGFLVLEADLLSVVSVLEDGLTFAESVLTEVNALMIIIDQHGKIKRFNKLCQELTGYPEEALIGKDAHLLVMGAEDTVEAKKNLEMLYKQGKPGLTWVAERTCKSKLGDRLVRWQNKLVESATGEGLYMVCAGTDITEERAAKTRLELLLTQDSLTKLANRYKLEEILSTYIAEKVTFSLLCLNLDNFRKVNDLFGHKKGDTALEEVAQRLVASVRDTDTVARVGGDTFLIALPETSEHEATLIAERIQTSLKVPFEVEGSSLDLSCSIGVALYPEHGTTPEDMMRCSDSAMGTVKSVGGDGFAIYSDKIAKKLDHHLWLDLNLRKALPQGELYLVYQPKVDLNTMKVEGVEALIRWKHPEKGIIPPLDFIPFAEESGLIKEIGLWVLTTACLQAMAWKNQGRNIRIAVNMSAAQLTNPSILAKYKEFLFAQKLTESPVDIELTESCFSKDAETARTVLEAFKELGAKIYLDDFGTGYSSLSQLVAMPIDVIKLDRAFVINCASDKKTQGLVYSVVAVASSLGCTVVAEGIETTEQAEFLKSSGIQFAQGYMYSKPLTGPDLEKWMQDKASK